MANYSKVSPSGLTNFAAAAVAATATPGTIFHTAAASPTIDEIWMWLTNTTAADITATIEFGGTGAANQLKVVVPANDQIIAVPGVPLTNALVCRVFAAAGLNMFGHVNRIS